MTLNSENQNTDLAIASQLEKIATIFANAGSKANTCKCEDLDIAALNTGLINHSYIVSNNNGNQFFLQQINKLVFTQPENVQENYLRIFEFADIMLPQPIYLGERKKSLYESEDSQFWRAFQYIPNSRSIATPSSAAQASETAKTFAQFTAAFDRFDTTLLHEVIPGFHNLSLRYKQFEQSLQSPFLERIELTKSIIAALKERKRYEEFYSNAVADKNFLLRVMHHDAKIGNILFDKTTNEVICPVDFDTVMPGYIFSDLGDMLRSMLCLYDENSNQFNKLSIRKDYYEAIVNGYRNILEVQLTGEEKKYLHFSGIMLVYMQALRFLTDFLNGDIYYKTDYQDHNLVRTQNQFTLLQRLEEFLWNEYRFKI